MASDGWAQAVREQLGPGRLVPLGAPEDGAWITERAALSVLSHAALRVPGVRPGRMRVGPADPPVYEAPVVPPPPSAMPPCRLRITVEFRASPTRPLPETAEQLRRTVLAAAGGQLGLRMAQADLHVTDLLAEDEPETVPEHAHPEEEHLASHPHRHARGGNGHGAHDGEGEPDRAPVPGPPEQGADLAERLAVAAATVPGVDRLASWASGVRGVRPADPGRAAMPPLRVDDRPSGRHVEVRLALAPGHRALDVTRAVRAAVTVAARRGAPGPVTVTALVTSMGEDD